MLQNEQASVKYCQAKLQELSKALMENISAGTFSVPGGHELYRKAKGMVESEYCQVPRKGVKVRNKGSMGVYRIESRGVPENLRAQHQVSVMREHGYIMTVLALEVHTMFFIPEEKCPFPQNDYGFLKFTRQNRNCSFLHPTTCFLMCQVQTIYKSESLYSRLITREEVQYTDNCIQSYNSCEP